MTNKKTCLIIGAGATFADANKKGFRYELPPLDKNFFWNHHISYSYSKAKDGKTYKASGWNSFIMYDLNNYFRKKYGYDIYTKDSPNDSLEKVLRNLYTDIFIAESTKEAEELLVGLMTLLNNLISTSTARIKLSMRNKLIRIINKLINDCKSQEDLTIISYNFDLQVEKSLHYIASVYPRFKSYFDFPNCYCLPSNSYKLTAPKNDNSKIFDSGKQDTRKLKSIKILKPHGSLNWFSLYPAKSSLLTHIIKSKNIMISRRVLLTKNLTFQGEKTFPVVIPPLVNKGTFIRSTVINNVWNKMRNELKKCSRLVVYGYSCPEADTESFNLLSQVFTESRLIKELDIINPDPSIITRLQDAVRSPIIHYYKNADNYA
ncbi:MAG: hypothetical protein JW787_02005 [Sedimentisphaerales bacterium]|nr:hypothetical protein [Sedimentisphaerales bacterium]